MIKLIFLFVVLMFNVCNCESEDMISLKGILKTRRGCHPTTWTINPNTTFAVDGLLRRVKYVNGYWVVVGKKTDVETDSNINYAVDPTGIWQEPSSFTTPTPHFFFSDVSHDGTNWATSTKLGDYDYISGVPSGNWTSDFVDAVGGRGCLDYGNGYWSMTGMKYSTSIAGPWSSTTGIPLGALNVIRYGSDGYWVGGAGNNKVYTALNTPIVFTAGTPPFNPAVTNHIFGAAYGNGYWVVVGSSGQLAYQTTPPTGAWTLVASPGGWGSATIIDVAFANNTWVIVGSNGHLATQTGVPTGTWTMQSTPAGTTNIYGIEYANGYWVATGKDGLLMYSSVC